MKFLKMEKLPAFSPSVPVLSEKHYLPLSHFRAQGIGLVRRRRGKVIIILRKLSTPLLDNIFH